MGSKSILAVGNPYYDARVEAAKYDKRLSSREYAAELLGICYSSLSNYEVNEGKPSPETVNLMADLYNAPELRNVYCRGYCPLGKDLPEVQDENLDRIAIKAMSSLSDVSGIKDTLLEIVKDGVIDDQEREPLAKIITSLDELTAVAMQIKNYAEKYL